ncbi:hypothetical protein [Salmon gill poxvirus]|nr:hypothetical protein [Salmon gill poxvirus]
MNKGRSFLPPPIVPDLTAIFPVEPYNGFCFRDGPLSSRSPIEPPACPARSYTPLCTSRTSGLFTLAYIPLGSNGEPAPNLLRSGVPYPESRVLVPDLYPGFSLLLTIGGGILGGGTTELGGGCDGTKDGLPRSTFATRVLNCFLASWFNLRRSSVVILGSCRAGASLSAMSAATF